MKAYGRKRSETIEYPDLVDLKSMGGLRNGKHPSIRSAKSRRAIRRRFKRVGRAKARLQCQEEV